MTKKIFRSICMAAMIVFLISLALIMGALYGYFSNIQMRQLHIQADMAARGVEEGGNPVSGGTGRRRLPHHLD